MTGSFPPIRIPTCVPNALAPSRPDSTSPCLPGSSTLSGTYFNNHFLDQITFKFDNNTFSRNT